VKAVRTTVDMVAVFRMGEPPEPVKFRFIDDGKSYTVRVDKVLDLKKVNYGNTKTYTYKCKSLIGRRERIYELRYIGSDIRWELYKI